jgi:hypothetical protein
MPAVKSLDCMVTEFRRLIQSVTVIYRRSTNRLMQLRPEFTLFRNAAYNLDERNRAPTPVTQAYHRTGSGSCPVVLWSLVSSMSE